MDGYDAQVRGAGVVGRALALALARQGLRVALLDPPARCPASADVRAYALNATSVALLSELKVWSGLAADAATPVYEMRVQGDRDGAALVFSAWQQHESELAWIVDAAALEERLAAALRFAPHVTPVEHEVPAALNALCEGKASAARERLGVAFAEQRYGQQAVATRVVSTQPHAGMARQWFRSPDVLALLPLDRPQARHSYAVVWSLPEARAEQLLKAEPAAFEAALNEASGGEAGVLTLAGERAAWPLMLGRAERVHGPGWVLLGDCAHVIHPLAGQGLNLGLADVACLARVLAQREPWRELGDPKLLARYARERAGPTGAMAQATDTLLRLFAHQNPALRLLRNQGLELVDQLAPLKRWLAQRALDG
jgi:2-polyprenyl-6-methoxyphenol hydroxylase-like FAD-dependent oxidoreductase